MSVDDFLEEVEDDLLNNRKIINDTIERLLRLAKDAYRFNKVIKSIEEMINDEVEDKIRELRLG